MSPIDAKRLQEQELLKLRQRLLTPARSLGLALEGELLRDPLPPRVTDTVIVKLKMTAPATRRIATALRAVEEGRAPETSQPFLATLVENGYALHLTPVFQTAIAAAPRGALRTLSRAVATEQPLKAARGLVSVKVAPGVNAEQLAAHLDSLGNEIEYAYVPPVKYAFLPSRAASKKGASKRRRAATNDPLASRQWGHAAVRIREARAKQGFVEAKEVIVAVLDSGIDAKHPDLKNSLHSYVNFLSNEDDRDYQGHGTHVAGIIAAGTNNKLGIAGLCAAPIMALKALPRREDQWDAEAYYRALAHPIEAGAKVLNLSLGGGFDPGERDIISDLLDAGITVVAAMGNEYLEGNPKSYPAAYDGVIAVGASDEVDRRADFSCTGAHISLVAPGFNILSTTPRYPTPGTRLLYDSWPGTSMAAPHVAAAAALLLAKNPGLTPAAVRQRLRRTADRVPEQTSRPSPEYGYGRLNIEAALG